MNDAELEQVAGWLATAERALFITGAGLSADSGLPTYRGIGGLYEEADAEEGLPIETILSGPMLARRPALTWRHLAHIEAACRGARPNIAHELIAAYSQAKPDTWVLTQNVDGFHRAAGTRNLIEIHGTLHRIECTACAHRESVEDYSALELPPACPHCGALLRPSVVLFGEMLPIPAIQQLEAVLEAEPDLVCVIGTSAVFPYIAEPVLMAHALGVPTVEINPGHSRLSELVSVHLQARAAEVLPALWQRMGAHADGAGPRP